jgi:hypothetical protein
VEGVEFVPGVGDRPAVLKEFGDRGASTTVESALAPATTYYYRVIANNAQSEAEGKPVEGKVESFTTPPAPVVSTGEAQGVTQTTAALTGTVNPEGAQATYYFAYISEAGYQEALKKGAANLYAEGEASAVFTLNEPGGGPYSGTNPQGIAPTPVSGLQPGQTYHYALVATSVVVGRQFGSDATFTTPAATPPLVSTGGVGGVSQNSATLSGTVTTNGLQTNYGFEIGTEPGNYGPATGLGSIGGAATEAVSVTLGELQPGTTYYYRVTATNADGTSQGQPATFTTPGFPVLLAAPAAPPLLAIAPFAFPAEEKPGSSPPKALTNKQKLAKALKACHKLKRKSRRASCERSAHQKYGPAKKSGRK